MGNESSRIQVSIPRGRRDVKSNDSKPLVVHPKCNELFVESDEKSLQIQALNSKLEAVKINTRTIVKEYSNVKKNLEGQILELKKELALKNMVAGKPKGNTLPRINRSNESTRDDIRGKLEDITKRYLETKFKYFEIKEEKVCLEGQLEAYKEELESTHKLHCTMRKSYQENTIRKNKKWEELLEENGSLKHQLHLQVMLAKRRKMEYNRLRNSYDIARSALKRLTIQHKKLPIRCNSMRTNSSYVHMTRNRKKSLSTKLETTFQTFNESESERRTSQRRLKEIEIGLSFLDIKMKASQTNNIEGTALTSEFNRSYQPLILTKGLRGRIGLAREKVKDSEETLNNHIFLKEQLHVLKGKLNKSRKLLAKHAKIQTLLRENRFRAEQKYQNIDSIGDLHLSPFEKENVKKDNKLIQRFGKEDMTEELLRKDILPLDPCHTLAYPKSETENNEMRKQVDITEGKLKEKLQAFRGKFGLLIALFAEARNLYEELSNENNVLNIIITEKVNIIAQLSNTKFHFESKLEEEIETKENEKALQEELKGKLEGFTTAMNFDAPKGWYKRWASWSGQFYYVNMYTNQAQLERPT